jgi:AraC-like DNA-binding protein
MTIEVFVAEQIGELIASSPHLVGTLRQDTPRISITKCVDRFFEGNINAFVKFFDMKNSGNDYFYMSKPRFIDLGLPLKIAFHTGTTLLNLLTNENALDDFDPSALRTTVGKRLSPRLKKENVLARLLEALEEKPPPSLNEIAERLGYSQPHILRRYFPQVYDQIRANYLTYPQGKRGVCWSTTRLQSNEAILAALEAALREELPSSLRQIARSLGYATSEALRLKFPEICKDLAEKRRKIVSDRRARIEGELKQAIECIPPIPLNAISKKLGYKTTSTLRTMFPEECRGIRRRYEEHIKNQLLSKVENNLRSILIETPPPPLKAALRRMGISDGFLRKYFLKEHRAISARFLKFRHQQSWKKKENERKQIKAIVLDFINREIIPSLDTVVDLLSSNYLQRTEVWATIKQARAEFASKT